MKENYDCYRIFWTSSSSSCSTLAHSFFLLPGETMSSYHSLADRFVRLFTCFSSFTLIPLCRLHFCPWYFLFFFLGQGKLHASCIRPSALLLSLLTSSFQLMSEGPASHIVEKIECSELSNWYSPINKTCA